MIGLTLVVSMGVFASSLKASFGDVIADQTNADLFLSQLERPGPRLQPVGDRGGPGSRRRRRGLGRAAGARRSFDDGDTTYSAIDPATAEEVMNLEVTQGSVADLGDDGVMVSKSMATRQAAGSWATSSRRSSPRPASTQLHVVGDLRRQGLDHRQLRDQHRPAERLRRPSAHRSGLVTLANGADQADVQDAISAALADHPDAKVLDQKGFEKEASGFIDKLLTFVTVMLLLAVLIALLGIVNTLALSVFERTRELGLLRAVGMTRAQVRAMVRWESVVISLIGALSGAGLGIGIGLALSQALKDEGIKAISIPGPQIALYVALAAVAGVLAALGPARSAAKVDVLRAVVTD